MKNGSLVIYILIFWLAFTGCTKDEEPPTIDYQGPILNSFLFNNTTLDFSVDYADNKELAELKIIISYTSDTPTYTTSETVNTESQRIDYSYDLTSPIDGKLIIEIEAIDKCGNTTTKTIEYEYYATTSGSLELNLKLVYDNEPLVMFQDYTYPDGRTLAFTRFSFFTSNISLDDRVISPIAFHNLTNNNALELGAEKGLPYTINNIPAGTYSELNLSIGVPEDLNAMDPGDFSADHPLARSAEHWFSWKSYVFVKVEGNLDSNGDGTKDLPIALHLGGDDAFRSISYPKNIEIISNQINKQELTIDLYKFFGEGSDLYNIDANPQIHSLSQNDAVVELADKLENTYRLK